MNAEGLMIRVGRAEVEVCVMAKGIDMQRNVFSRQGASEGLTAWLKKQAIESVAARIQVAGPGDMRLALELAGMLAFAGHTVSVGNICRFKPAKPTGQDDFDERQSCEKDGRLRLDVF